MRMLYIRTLDDTRKTLKIEDSMTVGDIMILVCSKMGIQNHEEYGLINEETSVRTYSGFKDVPPSQRERSQSKRSQSLGHGNMVVNLLRDNENEKSEKLKKKLHTDDDLHWLNPSQTLRQQGIDENNVLLLRRRYFYSDINVDSHDPIQLNLLYVQLKEAILNGTHPVTQEEAIELAGIQAQVQIGSAFQDKTHNSNYNLKDYLPNCYSKIKGIEKKIIQAHGRYCGISEIEAKTKYCQFCRSLKTYGISFYLVKEKVKGKNKLVHRLLGVSKDCVVRLDEKTKEVLKIWPLTSILKWAASKHAFTMDFGEYSPHEFYTAQTVEGEQISQLIGGYIDIILKKKKAQDLPTSKADEESTVYEENVQVERATIVQNVQRPKLKKGQSPDNGNSHIRSTLTDASYTDATMIYSPNGNTSSFGNVIYDQTGITNNNGNSNFDDDIMTIGTKTNHIISQTNAMDGNNRIYYQDNKPESPCDFLIGGSQTYYYKQMSMVEKQFYRTIDENIEKINLNKNRLDIGNLDDPQVASEFRGHHWPNDELSRRILNFEKDAKQAKVTDEMGAMNAAVVQALRSANRTEDLAQAAASSGYFDHNQFIENDAGDGLMKMQQSFGVVTVHFPTFVEDVRKVAYLRRKEGAMDNRLEEAEPKTQDLITAAKMRTENGSVEPANVYYDENGVEHYHNEGNKTNTRKAILDAVSRVGEASQEFLSKINYSTDESSAIQQNIQEEKDYQNYLVELACRVAEETANLVFSAKNLAMIDNNTNERISMIIDRQQIVDLATSTGLATSQLVACTKVLSPTIQQPACQAKLSEAVLDVSQAVESVLQSARNSEARAIHALDVGSLSPNEIEGLNTVVQETEASAMKVRQALHDLNQHLSILDVNIYYNDSLRTFQTCYNEFLQERDAKGMLTSARTLATVSSQMANEFNQKAKSIEVVNDITSDNQRRLFLAAQQLTEATSKLVQSIKASAQKTNNKNLIELRENVEYLNSIINQTNADIMQDQLIHNLQSVARATLTNATQLINTSFKAAEQARGMNYNILDDCQQVDSLNPSIAVAIQESRRHSDDALAQLELITTCQQYLEACEKFIQSNRHLAPSISDASLKESLEDGNGQLSNSVSVLRACLCSVQPLARQLQLTGTLAKLKRLVGDMNSVENTFEYYSRDRQKTSAASQRDSESVTSSFHDANQINTFKMLNSSVQQGQHAVSTIFEQISISGIPPAGPGDWRGPLSSDLTEAMADLVDATRIISVPESIQPTPGYNSPVDFVHSDKVKGELIKSTLASCEKSYQLVHDIVELNPMVSISYDKLSATSNELMENLSSCLNALPGQSQISEAISLVVKRHELFLNSDKSQLEPVRDVEQLQNSVTMKIMEFNQATRMMVSSSTIQQFKQSANEFSKKFIPLIDESELLAETNRQTNPNVCQEISHVIDEVCSRSVVFLRDAKRICCHPETALLHQQFAQSQAQIGESLNRLMIAATSNMDSTQRTIQMAIRKIKSSYELVESSSRSLNSLTYHGNVQKMTDLTMHLSESIRGIAINCQENQDIIPNVKRFAESMCKMLEHTAQVSYQIGISDPSCEPGRPGLVNFDVFNRAHIQLESYCRDLATQSLTNQQVMNLSEDIDSPLRTIINGCQQISSQASGVDVRHQLNDTSASLVNDIEQLKMSARAMNEVDHMKSEKIFHSIQSHLNYLVNLITTNPQLSGQIPRMTEKARNSQRPIIACGQATLKSAESILLSAEKMSQASLIPCKDEDELKAMKDHHFDIYSKISKEFSASISSLFTAINENAPGQRECHAVLQNINRLMHKLNNSQRNIINQTMPKNFEQSEEGFQKQIASSARAILEISHELGQIAKSDVELLGYKVQTFNSLLDPLVNSTIGAASRSVEGNSNSGTQLIYLEQTKTILEAAEQLVDACKNSEGNPLATHKHPIVDAAVVDEKEACQDLLRTLDEISSRQGRISTMVQTLDKARNDIAESSPPRLAGNVTQAIPNNQSNVLQNRLLELAREMQIVVQKTLGMARDRHAKLVPLSNHITQIYTEMVSTLRQLIESKPADLDLMSSLRLNLKRIGESATNFVKATGNGALSTQQMSSAANDLILDLNNREGGQSSAHFGLKYLDEVAEILDSRLVEFIDLLERQNPGSSACLRAASTVSGIIADLNTTILFASSGSVHPGKVHDVEEHMRKLESQHFSQNPTMGTDVFSIKESISRTAKALIDDTHNLVNGAGERQHQLADSTNSAVKSITHLADIVKTGANVLEPNKPDSQVALIRAVQNVAVAYKNLFVNAGNIDKNISPIDQANLTQSAKMTVENIDQLLHTLNAIKDTPTNDNDNNQKTIPIIEAIIDQLRAYSKDLQEETIAAASNNLTSSNSNTNSSFLSRYLSPEVITKFLSNDVRGCFDKIYTASKTQNHDDAIVASINTRQFVIDLICSVRAFIRHGSIPIESRTTCAQMSSDICSEFANLLTKLKSNIAEDGSTTDVDRNIRHIEDLSHEILELISTVNDGPRLVMYFRASSPQWRDVTEKYIGRHVAYHHHYVPSYQEAVASSCHSGKNFSNSISANSMMIQVPYDKTKMKFCLGSEASIKAREKMNLNYGAVMELLKKSQFDQRLSNFLSQCGRLFDFGYRLLTATGNLNEAKEISNVIQIGRYELVLALAYEDLLNLACHYFDGSKANEMGQKVKNSILKPSKDRLSSSIHQINQGVINLWLAISEQTLKLELSQEELSLIEECKVLSQDLKSFADSLLQRIRSHEFDQEDNQNKEKRSSIDYNGKIVSITVPTS